jgi:group I intron endonuclease
MYIGSSNEIYARWKDHQKRLNENRHCNNHLQSAWNMRGARAFEFYILEQCKESELLEREDHFIATHKTLDKYYGYNMATAARHIMCQEARLKIGAAKRGTKLSKETKQKISAAVAGPNHPFYGKHFSDDYKAKISAGGKGKHCGVLNPMWGKSGKNSPVWGRHHTEDHKKKMSDFQKGNKYCLGRKHSEETKRKISEANKGRVFGEEIRKHMSEGQLRLSAKRFLEKKAVA